MIASVEVHGVVSRLDGLGITRDLKTSVEDLPALLGTHAELGFLDLLLVALRSAVLVEVHGPIRLLDGLGVLGDLEAGDEVLAAKLGAHAQFRLCRSVILVNVDDGRPAAGVLSEDVHLRGVLGGGRHGGRGVSVGHVDCHVEEDVRVNRSDHGGVAAVNRGDGVKLRVGGDDDPLKPLQHLLDLGALVHRVDGEGDVGDSLLGRVSLVIGVAVESGLVVVEIGGEPGADVLDVDRLGGDLREGDFAHEDVLCLEQRDVLEGDARGAGLRVNDVEDAGEDARANVAEGRAPRRLHRHAHLAGLVGSQRRDDGFVRVFIRVFVVFVVSVRVVFVVFLDEILGVVLDILRVKVDGIDEAVDGVGRGLEVRVVSGPNLRSPQRAGLIRGVLRRVNDVVVEGRELGLDVADEAPSEHALLEVSPRLGSLEGGHDLLSLVERVHAGGVGDKRVEARKLRRGRPALGDRLEGAQGRVIRYVRLPKLRDEVRELRLVLQASHREDDDVTGDGGLRRGKLGQQHGSHGGHLLILRGGHGAVAVARDVLRRDVQVARERIAHDVDVNDGGVDRVGAVTRDDDSADEDKVRLDKGDVVGGDAGGLAHVVALGDGGKGGEDVVPHLFPGGVHRHLDRGPNVRLELAVAQGGGDVVVTFEESERGGGVHRGIPQPLGAIGGHLRVHLRLERDVRRKPVHDVANENLSLHRLREQRLVVEILQRRHHVVGVFPGVDVDGVGEPRVVADVLHDRVMTAAESRDGVKVNLGGDHGEVDPADEVGKLGLVVNLGDGEDDDPAGDGFDIALAEPRGAVGVAQRRSGGEEDVGGAVPVAGHLAARVRTRPNVEVHLERAAQLVDFGVV